PPLGGMRAHALSPAQRLSKRIFDLIVATLGLLILAPIFLVIGLLVRLDSPGPALFRQQRLGKHGVPFPMWKFRSMRAGAEQHWRDVAQRDERGRLIHKTPGDPRVTALGRLLRQTSIDELPQLINVVRGEMSLVGPRPEMPDMLPEYADWQLERFAVTPGMTGWWQINGRGDRLMHLHTGDDIYYIRHYSFWLDVKILWKTIGVVARREGAF
ncbi:MAG TPA: sugar transferase, partial [Herpetosiphonaceae bacterium]